jgi:hypothetical protein
VKRIAGLAAFALIAGLLSAGCGVSGQRKTRPAISGARLAAYARAVNLQAGDLPGIDTHTREGPDQRSEGVVPSFRCDGGGIIGTPLTIHSAVFDTVGHFEAVFSTVHLVPSAAVARRDIQEDGIRSVQQCVEHFMSVASGERGPLVDNRASIAPLNVSLSFADFAFSATKREPYKLAQPRASRTRLERVLRTGMGTTIDYLGFAHGRTIILLFDAHSPRYAPRNKERDLLRLLYKRASVDTL